MAEAANPTSAITTFNETTICDLLDTFCKSTYYADKQNTPNRHLDAVFLLMEKDYKVVKMSNSSGERCFQYPSIIPIMESSRHVTTIYEHVENRTHAINVKELEELCDRAKFGRCRQRFPVPVILFRGQHICRSSTLASVPEICYRGRFGFTGMAFIKALLEFLWPSEESSPEEPSADAGKLESKLPPYCDNIRNEDLRLLKTLNVYNVVDIMVEKRKVKHGVYISASEKVDSERYSDFRLMSLPYPGCEFFTKFHDSLLKPENLYYDWTPPSNNAELTIPNDTFQSSLNIPWDRYKYWDLIFMTQNYLRYIIKRLQEDNCGLLLHCISGWDRTPLFISMIRLSLWADGLVHETLNEYEILYLTLAYDWYLFGHHLIDRISKHEEIMAFCFEILRYITGEEFSAKPSKKRSSDEASNSSSAVFTLDELVEPRDRVLFASTNELNINENSSESSVEVIFEGSGASQFDDISVISLHSSSGEAMEIDDISMEKSIVGENVLPTDDTLMGALNDVIGTNKPLSPTNLIGHKTSPVTIGSPSKRQRSSSTGSTASSVSGTWVLINECGSVEQEQVVRPIRQYRLERVRTIFMSCYQKVVKKEAYGPPKSIVEDLVTYISSLLALGTSSEQDTKEHPASNEPYDEPQPGTSK